MRIIALALLVSTSFAFKAGDAAVEVALLDICSLEAAQAAAQTQEAEDAARLQRYARAARRAKAKAAAEERAAEARAAGERAAEQKAAEGRAARSARPERKLPRRATERAIDGRVSRATVDSLLELAHALQGVNYRPGGKTPDSGFDCSGFVGYVFRKFGFRIGGSSRDQATTGYAVDRSEAKAGDIIVFSRGGKGRVFHAGLIVEADDASLVMVHANQRGGVHILDIAQDDYWAPKVHSIRRVL